jgi:hypothetical protein
MTLAYSVRLIDEFVGDVARSLRGSCFCLDP